MLSAAAAVIDVNVFTADCAIENIDSWPNVDPATLPSIRSGFTAEPTVLANPPRLFPARASPAVNPPVLAVMLTLTLPKFLAMRQPGSGIALSAARICCGV